MRLRNSNWDLPNIAGWNELGNTNRLAFSQREYYISDRLLVEDSMSSLPTLILNQASESPEGALLCPNALLHLGARAAIDQALSRLARRGRLLRVCQGMYVMPIDTRFGTRPPAVEKVIASLSALLGETIVPSGGAAANALGLTTQAPVRPVYLTSGPNRRLKLGELAVDLRHASLAGKPGEAAGRRLETSPRPGVDGAAGPARLGRPGGDGGR